MGLATNGVNGGYNTFSPVNGIADKSPRQRASWISRVFLLWVNPILQLEHQKRLALPDVWQFDDENNVCEIMRTTEPSLESFWTALDCICPVLWTPILNQVVTLVSDPTTDFQDISIWLGLLFVSRVLKALLFAHVYKETQVVAIRFTAAVKSLIFQKSMRLSMESRTKKSTGDICNLYTTDVGNILMAAYYINEIWILPTVICIALVMLYRVVGMAAFAGFSVIVFVLVVNQFIARIVANTFEKLMEIKDERMKNINELFGAIQIVKFNAWESKFLAKITAVRTKELQVVWTYLYVGALNIFALFRAGYEGNADCFSSLYSIGTVSMMQEPLRSLPKIITGMIQAQVSLKRLLEFYELPERSTGNVTGREDLQVAARMESKQISVAIENGTFAWDAKESVTVFREINFEAKTGELVVVHGKVGSGNELAWFYVGGSLAYCPQQPWIQNMTIRDNICFGLPYDRKKYRKVIEACHLEVDLESFPAGDQTEIGQKGLNLSGGQKARISLARACYSDADIFLLDAPLAAVDAIVANEIFNKCILGLLRHKTRVLITHNPDIIASKFADSVLKLVEGQFSHVRNVDKQTLGPPPVSPLLGLTGRPRQRKKVANSKGDVTPEAKPAFAAISPSHIIQDGCPSVGCVQRDLLFDQMTHSLVRAPMSFFDVNPVGRILNRYSDDVSRLDFQLPFAYGSLLAVAFSVGCTLLTACVMTKYFGLIILPLLAIYVYLGLFYLQPARELQRLQKTTQSPILAHLSESNEGYSVIRAFDQVSRFCNQNAELIDTNNKTVYVGVVTAQWFAMRMQLMGGVIVVVIASSLTYMRFLFIAWFGWKTSMVSPERMQEYIDLPSEAAYELPNEPVEMGWPSNGRIHFEEVSFRYKEGDKLVLEKLDFLHPSGRESRRRRTHWCGQVQSLHDSLSHSRSGLRACSCRWREYRTLGLKTLRSRLSIITQSPVLFKGTFRNYLDPFSEYADEELWQLEAILEENGENLSVGERQMLCMGRALLSESKVVVMDEATAAIDAETDAKLQKVIKTEFKDATVLTIAHRLDTVLDGDRIMVLDAGRIVQFDTPMRLIAKGQGHFFQLAKEGGYLDRVVE
ncbi:hypothetical protein Ae201684P_015526 [Aphanomyces euteiches]|nr:hypothetical protein Ae201684P_015526 [Aphanomyces euteiches]